MNDNDRRVVLHRDGVPEAGVIVAELARAWRLDCGRYITPWTERNESEVPRVWLSLHDTNGNRIAETPAGRLGGIHEFKQGLRFEHVATHFDRADRVRDVVLLPL